MEMREKASPTLALVWVQTNPHHKTASAYLQLSVDMLYDTVLCAKSWGTLTRRCNPGEFGVDASFHSAEWHAARIAALTTERLTWDEWKEQQKEHLMSEEAVV